MTLVDAANSSKNSTETCDILSKTCSRFNDILKQKKDALLPHIHMKFSDTVFDSLPCFHDKITVSIRKLMKTFGPNYGVATSLAEIVDDKKWRPKWVIINPDKHSWYIIERYYWKLNEKAIPSEKKKDKLYWLKNDLYHLHFEDEEILLSPTAWLNDRIMNTVQKLICKTLGADEDYQSVLNVQKRWGVPYCAVKNEHIQLLNAGSEHWLFTFCSNGKIQICDSLKPSLSRVNRKCVHALYKNCVKEFIVSFLPVQKQTDGHNCGSFAIAFEAEIVDGKSPMEACFDVERMRGHLINCLENKFLILFSKVWSHLCAYRAVFYRFYTYGRKTLKISMKRFILAKLKPPTSSLTKKWTFSKMFF